MTSKRPYRPALSWQQCWEEVMENRASQFDAVLVETAKELWPVWEEYFKKAAGLVQN